MSYLQLHQAEMLDENSSVIEDLLTANDSMNKFHDMYEFDQNYAAHPPQDDTTVDSQTKYQDMKDSFQE